MAHYFWLNPPKEHSELDELASGDIDFDKLDARRRTMMGEKWAGDAMKGEAV